MNHLNSALRHITLLLTIVFLVACSDDDKDTTPPVITLNGESVIELLVGEVFEDPGATATDNRDANVVVTITGNVDTSVVGEYTLRYSATDSDGNSATPVTRTINVVLPPDTTLPVITLEGEATINIVVGTAFTDPGATATDDRDGNVEVTVSGMVDTATVGAYILTYDAQDGAGNQAVSVTRTVNVVLPPDVTAPVITLAGEANVTLEVGQPYEEPGATALDDRDGDVVVTISGAVDTSTAGEYVLTYNAQDNAGNQAIPVRRTVTVILPVEPITLLPVPDQLAEIGSTLTISLEITGIVEDSLRYTISPIPLPANMLLDSTTGIFTFTPDVDQAGDYDISFAAIDGDIVSTQSTTITVNEIDPTAGTSLQGRLLDANASMVGQSVPIVNATVTLLSVNPILSVTTDANGNFSITGITGDQHVLDLATINANTAPDGSGYAGFREKIQLIENTANVVERPFYLPRILAENQTPIDPNNTTEVANTALGVSVTVPPNTAVNEDGTLFTGNLSISEVPEGLAPAPLPRSFRPGLLVTIQPVGVRFTNPIPITFPNLDNLPAGDEVDIWSIDPDQGEFLVVGTARVSSDGERLETIDGGIRAADWHFTSSRQPAASSDVVDQNNENVADMPTPNTGNTVPAPETKTSECIGSTASIQGGCLSVQHSLASYRSLDVDRTIRFTYSSETANPYPVINVGSSLDNRTSVPEAFEIKLNKVGGVSQQVSHFVSAERDNARHAVQFDARDIPTGLYPYEVEVASEYTQSGISTFLMDSVLIHNRVDSPFGAGWAIAGLQQIHDINATDRVVITEGNEAIRVFTPQDENNDRATDLIIAVDDSSSVSSSDFTLQLEGIAAAIENPLNVPHNGNVSFALLKFSRDTTVELPLTIIDSLATAQLLAEQVRSVQRIGGGTAIDSAINTSVAEFQANGREDARQVIIISTDGSPNSEQDTLAAADAAISQGVDEISAVGVGSGANLLFLEQMVRAGSVFGVSDFNEFAASIGQNLRVIVGGSPAGEFSYVRRNADNTLTRVMKDGTIVEFDAQGLQTAFVDRNGNTTSFTYANGLLTSIEDPLGKVTALSYENGKLSTVTLPDGRTTNFSINASGDLTQISDPDSSSRTFTYADNHLLMSQTSKRNFVTSYQYDHQNRAVGSSLPDSANRAIAPSQVLALTSIPGSTTKENPSQIVLEQEAITRFTDGEGNISAYITDRFGRMTSSTDAIGRVSTMVRDDNGLITQLTRANGAQVTYSYDQLGNVLSQTEESINATYSYTYEPTFNQLATITDPDDGVTTFTYNANGNLLTQVDALGNTVTLTYNQRGQILTSTDPRGNVTSYAYNDDANLQIITDALGNTTNFTYDAQGNVSAIEDRRGNITSFTYDSLNRLITVTNPAGGVSTTTYDAYGNLASFTNPTGEITSYSYDELNRPTSVTHPITGTTTTEYDLSGRVIKTTDGIGEETTYTYDDADQLISMTNALGDTESFTYDQIGELASTTDAKGNETRFVYDGLGRMISRTDPENRTEEFGYDLRNNLIAQLTRNQGAIAHVYDAINRLTRTATAVSARASELDNDINYTYDEASNLTSISDLDSSSNFTYDALNRLVSETQINGQIEAVLTHTLDPEGNRTALNVAQPAIDMTYQYDSRNLLSQLVTNNGKTVTMGYDAALRMTEVSFPNNTGGTYAFDDKGRLESLTYSNVPLVDFDYSYTDRGNIASITEPQLSKSYSYDAIQQLLTGGTDEAPENYSYDEAYNRTTSHLSDSYTNNENNRLTEDNQFSYVYDSNGNLTSKTNLTDNSVTTYMWDVQNQMVSLDDGTTTTIYRYDGLGRRISKTVGSDIALYFYDGEHILYQADAQGNVSQINHHGNQTDQILVTEITNDSYYYHRDHQGSVRSITDDSGAEVNSYKYDSFGNVLSISETINNPYRYTGREFDAESGLYYFRARYYDSNAGRFIGEDPLLFVDGLNANIYVGNNAVNYVDPEGLDSLVVDSKTRKITHYNDDGEEVANYPYTSGLNGITDPKIEDKGPIPLATYTLNPDEITRGGFLRSLTGDWGDYRVPLHPTDGAELHGRSGFFIHGGSKPGSKGCIDVGSGDGDILGPNTPIGRHSGPVTVIVK